MLFNILVFVSVFFFFLFDFDGIDTLFKLREGFGGFLIGRIWEFEWFCLFGFILFLCNFVFILFLDFILVIVMSGLIGMGFINLKDLLLFFGKFFGDFEIFEVFFCLYIFLELFLFEVLSWRREDRLIVGILRVLKLFKLRFFFGIFVLLGVVRYELEFLLKNDFFFIGEVCVEVVLLLLRVLWWECCINFCIILGIKGGIYGLREECIFLIF